MRPVVNKAFSVDLVKTMSVVVILLVNLLHFGHSYYVSDTGHDSPSCGSTQDDPCGTLYFASYHVETFYYGTPFYVSGQNVTDIQRYINSINTNITHGFHPCFPVALSTMKIYFNETKITKMSDWYPSICNEIHINSSLDITNTPFMFLAKYGLELHNLIIDNYQFIPDVAPYGIMSLVQDTMTPGVVFSCYNCIFQNISSICPTTSKVNAYILNDEDETTTPETVSIDLGIISAWYRNTDNNILSLFPTSFQLLNNIFSNVTYDQYLCTSKVGFINVYVKCLFCVIFADTIKYLIH